MNKRLHLFISDVHLGLRAFDPIEREHRFSSFLYNLPKEVDSIYLLGDIFDFWYEYKYVIPRNFTRSLGALAYLKDRGVNLFFIKGNHDVWTYNYLSDEIGVVMLNELDIVDIGGLRFCLGHGDELIGDRMHLMLKSVFKNRFLQKAFSCIHPRWAFGLAYRWSKHNRLTRGGDYKFNGKESSLYTFTKNYIELNTSDKIDFFIFGHLHTPGHVELENGSNLYVLGEWIHNCDFLEYDSISKEIRWINKYDLDYFKK